MTDVPHEHDWQPVWGYAGRYRCSSCKVFGYKRLVVAEGAFRQYARPHEIVPYKCVTCGKPVAVAKDEFHHGRSGPRWVCQEHRSKEP